MLIISILLSGVNWIQTVTIVWSETSWFLGGWGDVCHGARWATAQLSKKLVLFLVGNAIEKYVDRNDNCSGHGSSSLFRVAWFHFHYLKFLQPPYEAQSVIPTLQRQKPRLSNIKGLRWSQSAVMGESYQPPYNPDF